MRSEWTEEKDQSTRGIFWRGMFWDHLPSKKGGEAQGLGDLLAWRQSTRGRMWGGCVCTYCSSPSAARQISLSSMLVTTYSLWRLQREKSARKYFPRLGSRQPSLSTEQHPRSNILLCKGVSSNPITKPLWYTTLERHFFKSLAQERG